MTETLPFPGIWLEREEDGAMGGGGVGRGGKAVGHDGEGRVGEEGGDKGWG
jgi:hypothetical protein